MAELPHPGSSSDLGRARSEHHPHDLVRAINEIRVKLEVQGTELQRLASVEKDLKITKRLLNGDIRALTVQNQAKISELELRIKNLEDKEQRTIFTFGPQVRQPIQWGRALSSTSRSDPRGEDTTFDERGLLSLSNTFRDLPSRSSNGESASKQDLQLGLEMVSPTSQPRVEPPPTFKPARPLDPLMRRFETRPDTTRGLQELTSVDDSRPIVRLPAPLAYGHAEVSLGSPTPPVDLDSWFPPGLNWFAKELLADQTPVPGSKPKAPKPSRIVAVYRKLLAEGRIQRPDPGSDLRGTNTFLISNQGSRVSVLENSDTKAEQQATSILETSKETTASTGSIRSVDKLDEASNVKSGSGYQESGTKRKERRALKEAAEAEKRMAEVQKYGFVDALLEKHRNRYRR
ncbi:MAG: hypothetical protein LQ349_008762 [Xanthoria aureola]|nr:MAG: hypothetical protein LQ349_008762 [Xanthoria aureola]